MEEHWLSHKQELIQCYVSKWGGGGLFIVLSHEGVSEGRRGYTGFGPSHARRRGPDDPDGGPDDPGVGGPDDPGDSPDDPASSSSFGCLWAR